MDHGCQNYNYVLRFYIFAILIKGLDSTILVIEYTPSVPK